MTLEEIYQAVYSQPSDINEHLPTLRKYAEQSSRVLELGTRYGTSTTALLAGQPDTLISLDISPCRNASLISVRGKTELHFIQADSRRWNPHGWNPTTRQWCPSQFVTACSYDLLFIDTNHTFEQVSAELDKYAPLTMHWIILHDTVSFPPVLEAVQAYLAQHRQWSVIEDHPNNNGLIVLERRRDERLD